MNESFAPESKKRCLSTRCFADAGFSLVELVVAMTLTVVVSSIAISTLMALNTATIGNRANVEDIQSVTVSMQRVTYQLRGATRSIDSMNRDHSPFIKTEPNEIQLWTTTGTQLGAPPKPIAIKAAPPEVLKEIYGSDTDMNTPYDQPYGPYILVQYDLVFNPRKKEPDLTNPVVLNMFLQSDKIFSYYTTSSTAKCGEKLDFEVGYRIPMSAIDFMQVSLNVHKPYVRVQTSGAKLTQIARVTESSVGEFTQQVSNEPPASGGAYASYDCWDALEIKEYDK